MTQTKERKHFKDLNLLDSNGRSAEHGTVTGYYLRLGNTFATPTTDRKRTQADE